MARRRPHQADVCPAHRFHRPRTKAASRPDRPPCTRRLVQTADALLAPKRHIYPEKTRASARLPPPQSSAPARKHVRALGILPRPGASPLRPPGTARRRRTKTKRRPSLRAYQNAPRGEPQRGRPKAGPHLVCLPQRRQQRFVLPPEPPDAPLGPDGAPGAGRRGSRRFRRGVRWRAMEVFGIVFALGQRARCLASGQRGGTLCRSRA